MKKRLLFISLAVALVLMTLMPATALARGWWSPPQPPRAQRFNATMTPTAIDPTVIGTAWPVRDDPETNVWPIVDLVEGEPTIVGWIVDGRTVYGDVSGDFDGTSTFTYGGILDTLQSGSMEGVLAIQTGTLDVIYLAASGTIEANVTEYYTFEEIAGWWYSPEVQSVIQCPVLHPAAVGCPLGVFFSQIYNNDALVLIPDGYLTFEQLQAWCGAIGVSVVEFCYGIYGDLPPEGLDEPDEATLELMYEGGMIPPVPGLGLLEGMYGDPLPLLPKTLTAEFKGTLRIDAGTGAYSGVSGQGTFGPVQRQPLTLHVWPNQHVHDIDGAIMLSGTYTIKPPRRPFEVDRDKLGEWMKNWKDRFGRNGYWQQNGFWQHP